LAWAISQEFPVIAPCGPETVDQVATSTTAGDVQLTPQERDWLDLSSDDRPF